MNLQPITLIVPAEKEGVAEVLIANASRAAANGAGTDRTVAAWIASLQLVVSPGSPRPASTSPRRPRRPTTSSWGCSRRT